MPRDPIPRARELRRAPSKTEHAVWEELRNRRMAGFKFRRQHPIDRYFADFACEDARLVVELDGESHMGAETYDAERTRILQSQGWRVIRFRNDQIIDDWECVRAKIEHELKLVVR